MFGLFSPFGMSPEFEKKQRERERRERAERLKQGVPWDPKLKWQPQLTIKAETWPTWDLFAAEPSKHIDINDERDLSKLIVSPCGRFVFYKKILPRGTKLDTMQGSKHGDVMFDADITIPALHERHRDESWKEVPWMSLTPMECMTQRPGIRFAKGHTIVAGLGLGWALIEIMRKKTVKKVTLVERSQSLVDWVLPRVMDLAKLRFGEAWPPLDVVVGDAYDVIPKMTADVAVIDIFDGYGSNDFIDDAKIRINNGLPRELRFKHENANPCPNIGRVWSWGAAHVGDGDAYRW
jgi:hypothetical protein